MAVIIDSYSETNQVSDTSSIVGQSFTGDGSILNSVEWYLKKTGSPSGSVYAKIYAHSGSFGTTSVPTGAALATSNPVDPSTVGADFGLVTFTFSDTNKITLANGTKYVVTYEHSLSYPNWLYLGQDSTTPTHGGNKCYYSGGSWYYDAATDLCFYVYGDTASASASPSASASASPSFSPSESGGTSPSATPSGSVSKSPSVSVSASPSLSPSASISLSPSATPSETPSPSPLPPPFFGLKIAKPGVNVITNSDPDKLIFSSDYGTLKYFTKQPINIILDASAGAIATSGSYTHNLGYYPFVEVFVSVYIGSPTGIYEYCPFAGSGAMVAYDATYKITTSQIVVYGQIAGASVDVWNFDFLVFIFKNDLNL